MRIEDLSFPEVEALRQRAEISQALLCRSAGVSVTTYQRWIKFLHCQPGGTRPQPRTIKAVRVALADLIVERQRRLSDLGVCGVDRLAS